MMSGSKSIDDYNLLFFHFETNKKSKWEWKLLTMIGTLEIVNIFQMSFSVLK